VHDPAGHQSVRRSYDEVAESYFEHFGRELEHKPLDRALLSAVVEEAGSWPVADIGCGPGHVAGWLSRQGARAVGIDLSAEMVEVGRRHFPDVEFRQGDVLALPAENEEFGELVALYSIIHLAPHELEPAFVEMRRVLRPSGVALVAFHVGTEVRHVGQWWGHEVDVDFRFLEPGHVADEIESAGLRVEARLERLNYPEEVETTRAYLLARRPASGPV
jgi:ubiquinone/menaquinone biosynthesis C-methylase UbiE